MEPNSASKKFLKVLNSLSEIICKEKDSFEKFKVISTFNYVVRNNTLLNHCNQRNFEEAMNYLAKLSPQYTVPRFVSILTKCKITMSENEKEIILVPKGAKEETRGKEKFRIENDKVGSGRDAVCVAAVQFASEVDQQHYFIDFNPEERRRKIEKHSEGNLTYEEYLNGISGNNKKRTFIDTEIMDDEGEIIVKADRDINAKGVHHPDVAEDLYNIFKGTNYGFIVKIMKNKSLSFESEGFEVINTGNVYTFLPHSNIDLVRGPEDDKLIEEILGYLRKVSGAPAGEKIGQEEYDYRRTYREVCKKQEATFIPDFAVNKEDNNTVQLRLLKGVSARVRDKYAKVKFDFEDCKENIQVNKDAYDKLREVGFTPFKKLTRSVTNMKATMRGLAFAEVVEQGTSMVSELLNSVTYMQSLVARPEGTANYSGRHKEIYISLFLDAMIRSSAQFPSMARGTDGVYRFRANYIGNAVDKSKDPYELNKKKERELIMAGLDEEEEKEEEEGGWAFSEELKSSCGNVTEEIGHAESREQKYESTKYDETEEI